MTTKQTLNYYQAVLDTTRKACRERFSLELIFTRSPNDGTVFCWSAVHLDKTTKYRHLLAVSAPSLDDTEKCTKLIAHTVKLAMNLRSFVE